MDAKTYTTWQLARLAECSDPDAHDGIGFVHLPIGDAIEGSPGADFLRGIAYAVAEAIEDARTDTDDPGEVAHEVADAAVPVYTHAIWRTFTDLGAYNEDPSEMGAETDDMTKAAQVCLYMIGSRLALALIEAETSDDDE